MDKLGGLYDSLDIGSHQCDHGSILCVAALEISYVSVYYRDETRPESSQQPIRLAPVQCSRHLIHKMISYSPVA